VKDFLFHILSDTAAFTIAAGLLLLAGRKMILAAIEHYFARLTDASKAGVEIEKQKESFLVSSRNDIYPEIVELAYRLRNDFRDGLSRLEAAAARTDRYSPPFSFDFGEPLFILTERLYKYRIFLPKDVFEDLHLFKRRLQDATVILNRLDRPIEDKDKPDHPDELVKKQTETFLHRYSESVGLLGEIYSEIDVLYPKITSAIRSHMGSILNRSS
jgi:hypothetical protein